MKTGWQTFETMPPIGVDIDVYSENGEEELSWTAPCKWAGDKLNAYGLLGGCGDSALLWRLRPPPPMPHLVAKARLLSINVPIESNWKSK